MNGVVLSRLLALLAGAGSIGLLAQAPATGPYRVIKGARVGGEGGWDYLFADSIGRRLFTSRDEARRRRRPPASPARVTVFNLDTLEPIGSVDGVGGNGVVVPQKSGYGFTSSRPVSMFDTKTLKAVKDDRRRWTRQTASCPTRSTSASGVFSHPTKDATVIDAEGWDAAPAPSTSAARLRQATTDGNGTIYVVMQGRRRQRHGGRRQKR